ncbi:MAG: efflux RND transporter periplasmic adaptor subunit [Planctomycetia bacterium]|nr:efflux RND transporter periplasmic adaptor subunit [Planctomycetia bacterium]
MNATRHFVRLGIGTAIVAGLALLIAWWPKGTGQAAAESDTWTCSMHPQIRLPNPGRCPICGMQLIPVSKLPKARGELETRAGLVTEPIQRRELFKEIRTVGKLDYSERQVAYLSSRVNGRVDRLFVDFTGVEVKKGDHLVELYSPELLVAQRELLIGLEAHEREKRRPASEGRNSFFAESTLESARTKLRLLGILDEQIAEIEETRKPTTHLTIFAPIGGTVIEKNVRLGQYLSTGDQVYRIADLDPIWLYLNIYEFDVAWVRFGQTVDVQLEAFPGESFNGSIMFIDPFLDDATRTIRVRVNIKNPDRLLKPQMFATATIHVRLRPDGSPEPTGLEGMFVCPMHPEVMQREPGKCSICAMPLEKVPERHVPRDAVKKDAVKPSDEQQDAPPTPPKPAKSDEPTEHKDHAGHASHAKQSAAEKVPAQKPTISSDGVLAIPVSAVLDTGRRRIAYRLTEEGAYELVDLTLGPRANATDESGKRREFFVVLDGIKEGDQVVSQSGFLLDSQRQIEGMPSLLYPEGQAGTALHSGHGGMGGMGGAAPKTDSTPATPGGDQH